VSPGFVTELLLSAGVDRGLSRQPPVGKPPGHSTLRTGRPGRDGPTGRRLDGHAGDMARRAGRTPGPPEITGWRAWARLALVSQAKARSPANLACVS